MAITMKIAEISMFVSIDIPTVCGEMCQQQGTGTGHGQDELEREGRFEDVGEV